MQLGKGQKLGCAGDMVGAGGIQPGGGQGVHDRTVACNGVVAHNGMVAHK